MIALAAPLLSVCFSAHGQSAADEYRVKAAFLFHFSQLVEWPMEAWSTQRGPLNLCVFDDDPAHEAMSQTIAGRQVGGRALHFMLLRSAADARGCHIVFLSRAGTRPQSATLKALRGLPVLTVGETGSFLSDGGMICFHLVSGRVRFDVNLRAAELSGIKISSRLLMLASYVVRNSPGTVGGK